MRLPDISSPLLRFCLFALTNPKAKIQDLESPLRMLRAVSRMGAKGAVPVPPELLPMGMRVLAQGYLNRVAMPLLGDWLLPHWMHEQSDPSSPLFVPRSVTNLMINQTERSWTALGLPGAQHPVESTVDRWGLLTPIPGGPSLDWWVQLDGVGGEPLVPGRQEVKQRLQGGLPVVVTAFEANGLRVSSEVWMLARPDGDWAAMQVVLFNIADLPLRGTFRFGLRPYNPEGISPIYHIAYNGHTLVADGRPGPLTWPQPDGWHLSDLRSGDLFHNVSSPPNPHSPYKQLNDPRGLAHGVLEYKLNIEPWEEAEYLALVPVKNRVREWGEGEKGIRTHPHPTPSPSYYSHSKAATMLRWRNRLELGMRVNLPHRDLQESWEANRCHLFSLHDGNTITPGPDLYHNFWFRDAAYMIYALSTHGYADLAEELLRGFAKRQRRDGSFISQGSEWDGTGQVMWAIAQHLAVHPDPQLEADLRPSVEKGARWISDTLKRSGGLMPPGISSEHLGPPDRYYWDNLWSLAGLKAARKLLGKALANSAITTLKKMLLSNFEKDAARCGGALPAAPGRPIDLGAVATLAAWYPLQTLSLDSLYLAKTLCAIEEKLFYDGALFVNTGHSGWGTYLNMRIAGCYLLLGSEQGWELIQWLLRHASPTYNWPEAIHTKSGGGSTGDGHHGWASAEWLLLIRTLLLHERADELYITPMLPESWLQTSGNLSVKDAPTSYGAVSYNIEWNEGGQSLRLDLDARWRTPPRRLVWRLPGSLVSVRVDGVPVEVKSNAVSVPSGATRVEVKRAE